jgi:starch-binding outer membrane protein, SusD/RagB family
MKNIFYKLLTVSLLLIVCSTSCEQMLETKPRASVEADLVLKDIPTTQATLNSCYAALRGTDYYGRGMVLLPELLADNCQLANPAARSGRGLNESQNLPGAHIGIWGQYTTINTLNLILEAVDNIVDINSAVPAQKTLIKAQALFLRALIHFDLVRVYAYNPNYIQNNFDLGVPIMTQATKDVTAITLPSRNKIVEVYEQVERDLLAAINFFTVSGTPNSNAAVGAARTRYVATRAACQALLARVYLYWDGPLYDKKQLAVDYATLAINSGVAVASTSANYIANWYAKPHPESIFEVNVETVAEANAAGLNVDNSLESWYTRRALGGRGWGDVIASTNLVNTIETEEAALATKTRANTTLLGVAGFRPGEPASSRETYKYSNPAAGVGVSTTPLGFDNIPVIRLSELNLIRAECQFRLGNEPAALADLNAVRARAGLGASNATGTALLDAIIRERRMELAFEGHRWFDFTRRGVGVAKPNGSVIPMSDFRILAPLPLVDVQANRNLRQNPGY